MSEPENLTRQLLREMRADVQALREETAARFDRVDQRLDAMHASGTRALKGFIGHRAMAERAMGSFEDQMTRREGRVSALEDARA